MARSPLAQSCKVCLAEGDFSVQKAPRFPRWLSSGPRGHRGNGVGCSWLVMRWGSGPRGHRGNAALAERRQAGQGQAHTGIGATTVHGSAHPPPGPAHAGTPQRVRQPMPAKTSSTAAPPAPWAAGGGGAATMAAWAAGCRFEQGEQHRPARRPLGGHQRATGEGWTQGQERGIRRVPAGGHGAGLLDLAFALPVGAQNPGGERVLAVG